MAGYDEALIRSLGGADVVEKMTHEERADALEEFEIERLDALVTARKKAERFPTVSELEDQVDKRTFRLGSGKLFRAQRDLGRMEAPSTSEFVRRLSKMPDQPTLVDFFKQRLIGSAHLLQSAALAKRRGESEEVVLACLLHDVGNTLMSVDHGYWGAQMIEPYVSEKVTFAIRYHQALRFFPDAEVGYEYPVRYLEAFGVDYVPPPYIQAAHDMARKHKWYGEARAVTMNDLYSFNPDMEISVDEFEDLIGRHFKQPAEGLGYDNTPVAHIWRSIINPDSPL